jgi:hypothetical protein
MKFRYWCKPEFGFRITKISFVRDAQMTHYQPSHCRLSKLQYMPILGNYQWFGQYCRDAVTTLIQLNETSNSHDMGEVTLVTLPAVRRKLFQRQQASLEPCFEARVPRSDRMPWAEKHP